MYISISLLQIIIPDLEQNAIKSTIYEIIYISLYITILNTLKDIFTKNLNQPQFIKYFDWIIRLEIITVFTGIISQFVKDLYLDQITSILVLVLAIPYLIIFVKIIRLKHHREDLQYLRIFIYATIIIALINGTFNALSELGFWPQDLFIIIEYFAYFIYFAKVIPDLFIILLFHRFNSDYNNAENQITPAANNTYTAYRN